MKLEWLGKYRNFFENLYYYTNTYGQVYTLSDFHQTSVPCSLAQIQILEYILENEEQNQKMAQVAQRLGVSPATFSKNVKKMVEKKLLEKYKSTTNKKEIIVKASSLGRQVYDEYVAALMEMRFRDTFAILDQIPAEYIDKLASVFKLNADSMNHQLKLMQERKQAAENPTEAVELIKIDN